jgi:tRNA dimethylallyltransferase
MTKKEPQIINRNELFALATKKAASGFHLFIIAGPTAVGKTDFSIELAKMLGAEILSCDSTLIYRGMDIGTAKPTAEKLAEVTHYGIDCADISQSYSIADYLKLAQTIVELARKKKRPLVIVGGSGFYLKSFYAPVIDDYPEDSNIVAQVRELYDLAGLPGLLSELKKLNPEGFGSLEVANPRRVTRALIRCRVSGKDLLALAEEFSQNSSPFANDPKTTILIERQQSILEERIRLRAHAMMKAGLLKEVETLIAKGIQENCVAANTLGYRECIAAQQSPIDLKKLETEIAQKTIKLIKKQRTFFKKQIPVDYILNLL